MRYLIFGRSQALGHRIYPFVVDAEDEEDARNRAAEMGTVVERVVPEPFEMPVPSAAPAALPRGPRAANFFLMVGAVICALGCVFAVLSTLIGLATLTRVAPLLFPNQALLGRAVLVVLNLVDGFIAFCFFAALVIVFVRVSRLK